MNPRKLDSLGDDTLRLLKDLLDGAGLEGTESFVVLDDTGQ
jgi:hypothetical protein